MVCIICIDCRLTQDAFSTCTSHEGVLYYFKLHSSHLLEVSSFFFVFRKIKKTRCFKLTKSLICNECSTGMEVVKLLVGQPFFGFFSQKVEVEQQSSFIRPPALPVILRLYRSWDWMLKHEFHSTPKDSV